MRRTVMSLVVSCLGLTAGCGGSGGGGPESAPPGTGGATVTGSSGTVTTGEQAPVSSVGGATSSSSETTSTMTTSASTADATSGSTVSSVGGASSTTASVTTGGGGRAATPSSGCGTAPSIPDSPSLMSGGVERTYLVDLPSSYDPDTAYPIVFGFHGASTSGETFRSAFYGNLLSAMGDEAIVVHPDALGDPTSWDASVDVTFFDDLLTELQSTLCIDMTRVFATGHSSGGFFTNSLGCERADVLRGIAPVSGGGPSSFGNSSCAGPVAAWIAHGENDDTVDFSSGEGSRDYWLEANGCDANSAMPTTPTECVEYSCDPGLPVRWCVHQDGHNWPDFAPQGIWDFFKSL